MFRDFPFGLKSSLCFFFFFFSRSSYLLVVSKNSTFSDGKETVKFPEEAVHWAGCQLILRRLIIDSFFCSFTLKMSTKFVIFFPHPVRWYVYTIITCRKMYHTWHTPHSNLRHFWDTFVSSPEYSINDFFILLFFHTVSTVLYIHWIVIMNFRRKGKFDKLKLILQLWECIFGDFKL